jgi:hypothetical protein
MPLLPPPMRGWPWAPGPIWRPEPDWVHEYEDICAADFLDLRGDV